MKFKKILFTFSFLLANLVLFSQQIGSGFAPAAINDFNKELLSGFYAGLNAAGEVDGGGYNHLLNLRHSNPANNHQLQIASSYFENDRLFFRKFARGLGSNNPDWHEIATRAANTFNGNQIINGKINSSLATSEGGSISLINQQKLAQNAAYEWTIYNMTGVYTNSLQFWSYGGNGYQSGAKLTLSDNGNVGIGTATPNSKLTIKGSGTGVSIHHGGNPYFGTIAFNREAATGEIFDPSAQAFQINNGGSDKNLHFQIYNGNGTRVTDNALVIKGINGYVGIGTPNPDRELTVNGTIHSKEVIVDTNITPDYVFQKYYTGKSELKSDYIFPTLPEIENFTKKNNHLPGVPSAKEMQEKGISLGEMSNILLQKIEELTLYTIEQQKELERLKAENNIQSKKIETLEKINDNLKELSRRLTEIENRLK